MTRTQVLQEIRRMRFAEAYGGWQERRLSQEEAARPAGGVCERTFRRYVDRYEGRGPGRACRQALGASLGAPWRRVDEVVRTEALYRERYDGWNVKHFHSFYRREHAGTRSYTWVKNTLQRAGLVAKAPARGRHRRRRERAPVPGMMLHQDGSTHSGCPDQPPLWDLIITLDDATSEHYSMFFVEQEGTASSLRGMTEVIPDAGAPVEPVHRPGLTLLAHPRGWRQGRPHPSHPVRARPCAPARRGDDPRLLSGSTRAVRAHVRHPPGTPAQGARPRGASTRCNTRTAIWPSTTARRSTRSSRCPAAETGRAFVPFIGSGLADVLCEHHERTVARDNCVSFQGKRLQNPRPDLPLPLHQGPGAGASLPRRAPGGVPRAAPARRTTNPMGPWWQTPTAPGTTGAPERAGLAERRGGSPVDLWTSPADRREPCGSCGQDRGQRGRVAHRLAHTLAPLAHKLPRNHHNRSRKNGQPLCYKTGQFYLLPTRAWRPAPRGDYESGLESPAEISRGNPWDR